MKRFQCILLLQVLLLALSISCDGVSEDEISESPNIVSTLQINPGEKIKVMATMPILADWVNNVAQERLEIESVMPHARDPHTYQAGAKDIADIVSSDVIFSVGLGYEERWLSQLLENHSDIKNIQLGQSVSPIETGNQEDSENEDQRHSRFDPHFWFDPSRAAIAVDSIADQLSELDPASQDYYQGNAAEYIKQLMILDKNIMDLVSKVPEHNRVIITGHDSLGYLQDRYNIRALRSVVSSVTSESGLTPQHLINSVEFIKKHNVKVIFLETTYSDKYTKTVADEIGIRIVTGLNVENLNETNVTYIDFMENNINIIVSNLELGR
ncbi:MAG: metal ABC transporter substrate-binding protein [Chloroflexota bacterium]|nr:metal ABC transporter substrate-binding protein [Chloroflexota bacterium]